MYTLKKILTKKDIDILGRYKTIKAGFLGGSFDPPHLGHLEISKIAVKYLKLDCLIWIINTQNPFKKIHYYSFLNRVDLCCKLINISGIFVSTLQHELKSFYIHDALKYLSIRFDNLFFVIGVDNLSHFHKWRMCKSIVNTVNIAIVDRVGYSYNIRQFKKNVKVITRPLKNVQTQNAPKIIMIKNKLYSNSSSEIRSLLP